jgi:hypothetical protein
MPKPQPYTWTLERREGRRWMPAGTGGTTATKVSVRSGEYRLTYYDGAGDRHASMLRFLADGMVEFPWHGWWPADVGGANAEHDSEPAADDAEIVRRLYQERYASVR